MKFTKQYLVKVIKEELEATNENNSRLSKNVVHIIWKQGPTNDTNPGDRRIIGIFSSPEGYEKWFMQRSFDDPDFNRDDYDVVGYMIDVL